MLEITAEVKDRTDIGMTLEAASDLMSELESFRDKTKVFINETIRYNF